MLQAGAELWVLHARLDLLDDRTGGLVCLPGLLRPSGCGVEVSQGEVGLPELRRVANGLGQRQGLPQPPLCFVPLAVGRAISPWSRQPLTRYFRELVRVAMSRHWAANSCAVAGSPRASQRSPRLAKRWVE